MCSVTTISFPQIKEYELNQRQLANITADTAADDNDNHQISVC